MWHVSAGGMKIIESGVSISGDNIAAEQT